MAEPVLHIDGLSVSFWNGSDSFEAVSDVSFSIGRGEIVALLGESGSGKTVTGSAVMGLLPMPPASIDSGRIRFMGKDITGLSDSRMRRIRGRHISMIFQDALAALNPVYSIGWQIAELFRIHGQSSRSAANRKAVELLKSVGIPDPERRAHNYPHEFSGGMRQRVVIAMAIALNPELIIADEPTTALDVTVQAQIIDLLVDIRKRTGSAILFVTHDLGVVAEIADKVVVMYAGRVVETGTVSDIFHRPVHPYTKGLLDSRPRNEANHKLNPIPGSTPVAGNLPSGCPFRTRCRYEEPQCALQMPELLPVGASRASACRVFSSGGLQE